ncbi:hypothetical protein GCM10011391_18640 [Pullulanibacillus camelliae]|uniref:N-acetyltransferase domain-containing protein n=1 Tax=Pullulanibacillus camelliae TaxID=1707096 RepID=A0A8J2VSA5_9BACL|nr:GNAT family N-acetyltransferase [Pullulanibacillus camelliae]GGE40132.1 hypothetical protein GCM10011391_18640 [Pullulanibacillus camelliae]
MECVPTHALKKATLTDFFTTHWGSTEMVISSGVYRCDELDGFAILSEKGCLIGLITYILREKECEIISLDSLEENKGIGTQLINRVEEEALRGGRLLVKLITTNDNMHALGFYQKRGYRLVKVLLNAVDEARKLKPEIPKMANNGIPILDEWLLEKSLSL